MEVRRVVDFHPPLSFTRHVFSTLVPFSFLNSENGKGGAAEAIGGGGDTSGGLVCVSMEVLSLINDMDWIFHVLHTSDSLIFFALIENGILELDWQS